MPKPLRFGSALSAIALASALAGCATPGNRGASIFGGKVDSSNIGVATRALVALNAKDYPAAVKLAERAVENSPNDAGFRALLGKAYFASGRFSSAASAFRDSLALLPQQPQVVLKLALVEIAQGRNQAALSLLARSRDQLEAADFGLAVALAGQPQQAVAVLEAAARETAADSRVRQNLALAHALAGDWTAARTVAAQDLSADLVDSRIQQWMAFAKPARPSDQVAALTGFAPAAGDPGQPSRLALRAAPVGEAPVRSAEAAPVVEPVQPAAAQAAPVVAFAPPPQAPAYVAPAAPVARQAAASQFDQPTAPSAPDVVAEPVVQAAAVPGVFQVREPAPAPVRASSVTVKLPLARPASLAAEQRAVRNASFARFGNSTAVVQLGAYGSPQRVAAAWNTAARRYSVLRSFKPVSARFNSSKGLVYRLSVKGFDSVGEAKRLCSSLRRAGASCFVRSVAGDAPVQLASR